MVSADTMTILSHNAFWFQGVPFSTDRPGSPQSDVLSGLVVLYRAVAPDVVCLQEVQSRHAFARVRGALGMEGMYCPGVQLGQYGGIVLHRTGRLLVDAHASPVRPQRMWQVVEVFGSRCREIRVCNLHLPSGRQLGPDAAARQRVEEVRDMLSRAERLAGPPDVIVGDFNEPPDGDVAACLAAQGYHDAARLTGNVHRPTSLGGGRGDQIWVHSGVQDRLTGYNVFSREAMAAAGETGKSFLSDHMPVWVVLDTHR